MDEITQGEHNTEKNCRPRTKSSGTLTFKPLRKETLRKCLEKYLEKGVESKPREYRIQELRVLQCDT